MFQSSRGRLLTYYSLVMGAILILFSIALYVLFSRSLYYHQLDTNLETLARLAAPSFARIQSEEKAVFEPNDESAWRDFFDEEQQSLEWFDRDGKLLASQGNKIKLGFSPSAKEGFWRLQGEPALAHYQIQTFTLTILIDRSSLSQPPLLGYVRSSETTENLQAVQQQFLGQLIVSIVMAFGVVGMSGLWLTKKALEPAEQSFQKLKQFTADASHELRNPLTVLRTSIEVMRSHPERFQAKDLKKLNAIASATEQMTDLTKDLLFLARTEGAKERTAAEWQKIALHHLLEDSIEWLETVAQEKQIQLDYQWMTPVELWGNASQLRRLFGNLLENALQYTPSGGRVCVRLARKNQTVLVTVKDTGIGIPSAQIPMVFDRFWRADRARDYRQGGTGLGLAIVQAIVRQHGGQIHVTSQEGIGSCFQVSLPLHCQPLHHPTVQWSLRRAIEQLRPNSAFSVSLFWKKLALVMIIALLSCLPLWIARETFRQTSIFKGIYFAHQASSFADEIVYEARSRLSNPSVVLGIPNSHRANLWFFLDTHPDDLPLRRGDRIAVRFTDNLLTGSGDSGLDLWIFSKGLANTALIVEISKDRRVWEPLGTITPANGGIDIDSFGWGKGDFFAYVRLTYPDLDSTNAPIYLDAIGAISSVSLVRTNHDFWFLSYSFFNLVLIIFLGGLAIYWGIDGFKSSSAKK
jgi:OmpR-family two-component system manganese-sensing sensor histidine kinase